MFQRSNNSRSPNNESPIKEGDIHLKYNDSYSPNKYEKYDREDRRN
jgi:hypothetical protein